MVSYLWLPPGLFGAALVLAWHLSYLRSDEIVGISGLHPRTFFHRRSGYRCLLGFTSPIGTHTPVYSPLSLYVPRFLQHAYVLSVV